jgi:uncharacterized protein involved in tolerance to divalent cations
MHHGDTVIIIITTTTTTTVITSKITRFVMKTNVLKCVNLLKPTTFVRGNSKCIEIYIKC